MEKILFFCTLGMARFWYDYTLRYLVEKGYDSKKADPTHLELEIGEVRLVYRSMSKEQEVLCGRKYIDVFYYCENRFDNDFEKTFLEILGGKDNG